MKLRRGLRVLLSFGMVVLTAAPAFADFSLVQAEDVASPFTGASVPFGFYRVGSDGLKYAVLNGVWTWSNPVLVPPDPFEGWTSVDVTAQSGVFFRQMTGTVWASEGNGGAPPVMNGNGFVLCGTTKPFSDNLGWSAGLGYGNNFCQRLTSPEFMYPGSGLVSLIFWYFSQSQPGYDYTRIWVEPMHVDITGGGFTGDVGIDPVTGVLTPVIYPNGITNAMLGGGSAPRPFHIVVEFTSDGSGSDEDGGVDSWYGPFGMDDFGIGQSNAVPPWTFIYDFNSGLQGWVPSSCPGVGSYYGVADVGSYTIMDPCPCALTGNVMAMHDPSGLHPDGQHEMIYSPIVDRKTDLGNPAYLQYNRIMAEWDQYSDLSVTNGVFYRAGWSYFPYDNPVTGAMQWSPRVGIETFYYTGETPVCGFHRNIGTDWGVPGDCEQVKFIYELFSSCAAFGQVPCSGVSNFSPLIDNVQIRNAIGIVAPAISLTAGSKFQDGFGRGPLGVLSTTDPGNADVVYDVAHCTSSPTNLADCLVVGGAPPTTGNPSSRWEAKFWFRLNRLGPGQGTNATYNAWHGAIAGAKGEFVGANASFAWGYMDSVEAGTKVERDHFCSRFRDGPSTGAHNLPPDANYNWGGGGELGPGNEMLPDQAFTPGTQIQYYITANYVNTPAVDQYLPDVTGGNYFEFEILPSFRNVGGIDKFPCALYIDAYDGRGDPAAQYFIEQGLNIVMNGLPTGSPIPNPTMWDRYDYGDASSNWKGPFYHVLGGNNGASTPQMMGYSLMILNTGNFGVGCMEPHDWGGFHDWLTSSLCSNLQGFIANGSGISAIIDQDVPAFLTGDLGATHICRDYNTPGCPPSEPVNDTQFCTGLAQVPGPFGPSIPTDIWHNWCPNRQDYSVLGVTGTGVGNVEYAKLPLPGARAQYAQVINDQSANSLLKYRTIIEDQSYHMMITPNPGNPGPGVECDWGPYPASNPPRIDAVARDLALEIDWLMGAGFMPCLAAKSMESSCVAISGVPDLDGAASKVTQLYENRPNPFNPRTEIRFSLAADGPAKLVIFDVSGRQVRTLVDNEQKAGAHSVVWDGTDDFGHTVTSGVYWSQLHAGAYTSNRKMVVLR